MALTSQSCKKSTAMCPANTGSAIELANVYDHRLVRALRDAAAYQALKAQKPAVMQKAQNAPRMPSKQAAPAQVRRDQAIEQKFKSGRAKLNDLAAFLR